MISKIVGGAKMSKMMRLLRGGPQSLLPMSPLKGSGIKSMKGVTPKAKRGYVVAKQQPKNLSLSGLMKGR